uniref:Staphylococcal nuclease domain-containing protein 1 n=1 Tax=Ditylenchus dipsaci TaxID=166011 RepID=A0A915CT61_9BILA
MICLLVALVIPREWSLNRGTSLYVSKHSLTLMTDISAQQQAQSATKRGFVKQVISGDAVVLQGPAQNGPPKEVTVYLANINSPRLARRPVDDSDGSPDEPYAWEAREFLRKKIVGQTVVFVRDFLSTSNREHGRIYLRNWNFRSQAWKQIDENTQKLLDLQEQRKLPRRVVGPKTTYRDILVAHYKQAQIDAVVEQVRDGSTLRLFLLPSFEYVTVMLSGVKSPSVRSGPEGKAEEFGEEAKFFVESRYAKDRRIRMWKNYSGAPIYDRKSYSAKVVEIGLGDSINVVKDNEEEVTKKYFSSLRPPRRDNAGGEGGATARQFRPLYDIPFSSLILDISRTNFSYCSVRDKRIPAKTFVGKRVTVVVDYVQPKSDQFPEKTCCSVSANSQDIGELLVSKGLAKVVRHRQDDDGRSSRYDALLAAEAVAEKEKKGMWADKSENSGLIRVQELQGDAQRSKQFLPYLQRSSRPEGIVEFVSSGSRMRVYVPKETCLITFLLAGISCPRGARIGPGGKLIGESDPGADEALAFTKSKCLQHEVQIEFTSQLNVLLLQSTGYVENDGESEKLKQVADMGDRKINCKKVVVTEVYPDLHFAAQLFEEGPAIEKLMGNLQNELSPGTTNATLLKRGQLVAARYKIGNLWHRVKVESIRGNDAEIYYVDFGNREQVKTSELAVLPMQFHSQPAGAKEFQLAWSLPLKMNTMQETPEKLLRLSAFHTSSIFKH